MAHGTPNPDRNPPRPVSRVDGQGVRHIASHDLLGDAKEIVIKHGGREYRLRVTQSGKLILTA
jgi:hemin uptake protein HemP